MTFSAGIHAAEILRLKQVLLVCTLRFVAHMNDPERFAKIMIDAEWDGLFGP